MKTNRRTFLRTASLAGVPFILPSHIWAAETKPNSRPTIGIIGMGIRARQLLTSFLYDTQVLAICDVDTTRREDGKKRVDEFYTKNPDKGSVGCKAYNDFRDVLARKDIDMVYIGTPDHWHAAQAIAAMRAGKDVYCEKPLSHNIRESLELIKVVDETGRVFQTGAQQRSDKTFRIASELVRNGCIGKIERVECAFGGPAQPYNMQEEPMEPGLDWDLWCGPGPKVAYNSVLSPRGVHTHFPRWRGVREFGGGSVADLGAHHLDIVQWALDMDASGPVEARPSGSPKSGSGGILVYANGVTVTHIPGFSISFYGSEGTVDVSRGIFRFEHKGKEIAKFMKREDGSSCEAQVQKAEREFLKDAKVKLYLSKSHLADFLACVVTRQKPISNVQIGARSAICCHLLNQAYYNNAKLRWDPVALKLTEGDPKWLTRDYRAPWSV